MIHCPYCGNDDLDWTRFTDTVKWYEEDGGVMYTSGLRCRDPACKGAKGFRIRRSFTADPGVEFIDEHGYDIEPMWQADEDPPSP